MSQELINLPDWAKQSLLTFGWVDDFDKLDSDRWTTIEGDTNGSVDIDADGVNGVVSLTVTTTDNEEAYLHTLENFKFVDGKPMLALARLQFAEAATDDVNILFGFVETWAADTLQDGGLGPKADYDGAVWYKVDGGTRWNVEASDGTSQKTTETSLTAGQAGYQVLGIEVHPVGSVLEVRYLIDQNGGNALKQPFEHEADPRTPAIVHRHTFAGAGEMGLGFGIKNGGANSEALNVDLASVFKRR